MTNLEKLSNKKIFNVLHCKRLSWQVHEGFNYSN